MSRINPNFENVLEKIARIMTRRFNIAVVFEGNVPMTDGKTITLPRLEDVSDELKSDLNGFLDHEVAHCKYTDFTLSKKFEGRFHREISNAIEDSRIERLLPLEYPGTALSLERINHKWQSKLDANFSKLPWPIRFILSIRNIADGKPIIKDEQIAPLIASVLPQALALRDVRSTEEVIDQTQEIIRLVNLAREELYKGMPPADDSMFDEVEKMTSHETPVELDPDRENKESQEAEGEEQLDPATKYDKSKSESEEGDGEGDGDESEGEGEGKKGKGDKSEDDESEGDSAEEGESEEGENEGKGKGKGDKASVSAEGEGDEEGEGKESGEESGDTSKDKWETRKNYADWKETATEKQMLDDAEGDKSEFDNHEFNTESYMETQFEKAVKAEPKVEDLSGYYSRKSGKIDPKHVSIPYTQKFDTVTDLSGRGDHKSYGERKNAVMKYVRPITQHLERVLLVKENRKMRSERERGMLNNRTLANLIVDKNYRTPFREFTKTDTTNVAVSLVIDCSGSMRGNKIEVARQTALALGESLKNLQIATEILGFNTKSDYGMYSGSSRLGTGDVSRFNRFGEALNHMVFKSFDSPQLSGICRAESGGCNADGESITWAAKRLALRPEKRKIMIVLSDGQPSYGGANHEVLAGDLKRVINMLPKAGIEVCGIGICTKDVELFYDDYVVVEDIKTLATTVMSKLARFLEDGYK